MKTPRFKYYYDSHTSACIMANLDENESFRIRKGQLPRKSILSPDFWNAESETEDSGVARITRRQFRENVKTGKLPIHMRA